MLSLPANLHAAETVAFKQAVQPFLAQHCARCHDGKVQKGNFRMDTLPPDFANLGVAQRWAEVITRMNAGEMPPPKEPQPTPDELGKVVDWIATRIKEGEAARMAKRGPLAHYRLSREEYANTIYDLLGVYYDVTLPGAFNEEPRWHGFERIGAMLSLSPSHVDRYFKAAETVLERAFPEQQPQPVKRRADAIEMAHRESRKRIEALGIADKVRVALWPGYNLAAFRGYFWGQVKEPGIYRARIQLSGLQPRNGRAPHLSVWHPQLKRTIFDQDIIAPEDKPVIVEFETFLTMPAELDFINEVPGKIPEGHTRNVLMSGGGVFTNTKDTSRLNPTGYKLFDESGTALRPLLLVDWVEWEGPLLSDADRKKREGFLPEKINEPAGDMAQARETLQRFASRAWRRPATEAEVNRYLKVIEKEMAAGEKFRAAYMAALTGILASNNFYYLAEGSPTVRRDRVSDWELASRLSYFLWGSLPDAALLQTAQDGTLHTPEVLRAQLARMMADPKIARFTEAFPRQWLQLHKVGMFAPDEKLYPDYDKWLEKSMVLETTGFFNEVFARNLSIREFLSSDWTMANPRLALHYKLPPLPEAILQRVGLRPEGHRGGLLTQAAILSLTSDGTRHRPVHRGVWVSEAIFGKTPPPPPPNVEPIEPTPATAPKATVRQQIEAHSTNSNCASCHKNIDPLGFAFDNYDAVGRWRNEEVAQGKGDNPPVNAAGTLPDGRAYNGPDEFKKLLIADLDRFAPAFVENLATFALRRAMTLDDQAQLKTIAQASKKEDYKMRTVIENLVLSDLFQKR